MESRDGSAGGERSDLNILSSGRAVWVGLEEGQVSGASVVVLRLQFSSASDEHLVRGVRVGEPGREGERGITMLKDVNTRCFGNHLREGLRHWDDGTDYRDEVIKDGAEFIQVVGGGGEENIIGVNVGGFLEVGSLEIERGKGGATVEITEQNRVENGRKHLIPFTGGIDGGDVGGAIRVDTEDVSTCNEGLVGNVVGEELEELAGEEILLDVGWLGITRHSGNAVMEVSEEVDRNKTAKEMV